MDRTIVSIDIGSAYSGSAAIIRGEKVILKPKTQSSVSVDERGAVVDEDDESIVQTLPSYKMMFDSAISEGQMRTRGGGSLRVNEVVQNAIKAFGETISPILGQYIRLQRDSVTTIVTHPVLFKECHKDFLQRCVSTVGWISRGDIVLIPESEAAAMYAAFSCKHVSGLLAQGNVVLVADFGGFTIDVSQLKVVEVEPFVKFRHYDMNVGFKCGGESVIDRILSYATSYITPSLNDFENSILRGDVSRAIVHWKYDEPNLKVRLSRGLPDFNVAPGNKIRSTKSKYYLLIDSCVVVDAIDHVFLDVVRTDLGKMVRRYRAKYKSPYIVLTGGMASNPYLKSLIQKEFDDLATVVIPENPQNSVMEGALIAANGIKRVYQTSYGIVVHDGGKDVIEWFVKQGQDVNTHDVIFPVAFTSRNNSKDKDVSIYIYCSSESSPGVDPKHANLLGEIVVDSSSMKNEEFNISFRCGVTGNTPEVRCVYVNALTKRKEWKRIDILFKHYTTEDRASKRAKKG